MSSIKPLIEALLFINGKNGVTNNEFINILKIDEEIFKNEIRDLIEEFSSSDRGIEIKKFGQKYVFVTKTKIFDKLFPEKNIINKNPLSSSLIETLAIIAYNSPCTRTKIHEIRKLDPTQQIEKLLELDLINELGRSDTQGKPFLYEVSDKFYDIFGIDSLDELPQIKSSSFNDEEDIDFFDSNREE